MRRLSLAAFFLAVPLLFASTNTAKANPPISANFGCGGYCFKLFPHIHQHGPLFNYGPYYGYYPFTSYGPWDPYLRYDPNFYGQGGGASGDIYGLNPRLRHYAAAMNSLLHHDWFHRSSGFCHASWLDGGWFRGHKWLDGGHGCGHTQGCQSCGGVAIAPPPAPPADPTKKYTGIGNPTQSAVFYSATPTLNPALELVPTAGRTK